MNVRTDLALAYYMGYEDALAKRKPDATKAGILNSYNGTNSEQTTTVNENYEYCSECGRRIAGVNNE